MLTGKVIAASAQVLVFQIRELFTTPNHVTGSARAVLLLPTSFGYLYRCISRALTLQVVGGSDNSTSLTTAYSITSPDLSSPLP